MFLIIAFILTGFIGLATQAILVRELVIVFFGNELSLGIIFASWLFWVAVGSLFLGRRADRVENKLQVYISLQIFLAGLLPLILLGVKAIRFFWNIPPGEFIVFFPFLISTFFILAPVGLILGFQFALACRLYAQRLAQACFQETPKAVGKVYWLDALGNMLGGVSFTYLFVQIFPSFKTVWCLAILNLLAALLLSLLFLKKRKFLFLNFFLLLIFSYTFLSPWIARLNHYGSKLEWKGLNLKASFSSKFSDYTIIKDGKSFYFYSQGQLLFTLPEKAQVEERIHLPFSQIENPERILLIGGGMSGALTQALKYACLKEVFYLEKDPRLIRYVEKYLNWEDKRALRDPRVHLIISDGRLFVKNYQGEKFDGIILNVGNPLTAEINRFYTLEFFREVERILEPQGVFFFGVDSHENYLSPEMRKFNGCIFKTLKAVFPQIVLYPGNTLYLASSLSRDYLTAHPEILSQRLKERKIFSQYINEYTLPERLNPERLSYIQGILFDEEKKDGRLNHDFLPISYYYNLILWGSSVSSPRLAQVFWRLSPLKFSWLVMSLIFLSLFALLIRKKLERIFIPLAVFIGGLAGISLELILMVGFQIIYGNLYYMLGLIVASFMFGLVLGASFITRRLHYLKRKNLALSGIELALGIYALVVLLSLLILDLPPHQRFWCGGKSIFFSLQILFPLLTLLSGFWVGMIFPLANNINLHTKDFGVEINLGALEKVGSTAGKLYAFDLFGACFGSLATTVFFIPLFGLIKTVLLISLVCFLGFLFLFSINKNGST